MEQRVAVLENELTHMRTDIQELTKTVKAMNDSLTKYRGMWGGMVMVVAAMGVGIKLAFTYFK
jgi:DNA anti-recombination protein RmuC